MRKELKKIHGERIRFFATVGRFGQKKNYHGYPEPTILLKHVQRADTGQEVADHVWFIVGKRISDLDLSVGEKVSFEARVADYIKGYVNYRQDIDNRQIDYKLSHPTRFQREISGKEQSQDGSL